VGIAATPDGRSLIVVQMTKGLLFKLDIATKKVTAIDTAGADLSACFASGVTGRKTR
jgi:hypothetical protein